MLYRHTLLRSFDAAPPEKYELCKSSSAVYRTRLLVAREPLTSTAAMLPWFLPAGRGFAPPKLVSRLRDSVIPGLISNTFPFASVQSATYTTPSSPIVILFGLFVLAMNDGEPVLMFVGFCAALPKPKASVPSARSA